MKKFLLLFGIALIALYSCRKDIPIAGSGVQLRFSTDTVFLDTVFTQVGSSTYNLKVYNPTDEIVNVDNIRLGRNQSSQYRLNIDGQAGNTQNNLEIPPNDSIYIFIEITPSKIGTKDPLYTDSIIFSNKGTEQNVKLVTLARDVYFHFPTNFIVVSGIPLPYSVVADNQTGPVTLPNDKPHVFYGYGLVNDALIINPGTELYFHQNSGLMVLSGGTMKVAENAIPGIGDSVIFAGDRLEPFYENAPGQWGGPLGGIYIGQGSNGNIFNNSVIKNATTAIRVDSAGPFDNQLTIANSYVMNNSRTGLYGGHGNVKAVNTVFSNAGLYVFYAYAGNYKFIHCTFANYWNQSTRSTAGVTLTNFIEYVDKNGQTQTLIRDLDSAYFGNCIIMGSARQELSVLDNIGGNLNYEFHSLMLKLDESIPTADQGFDVNDPTYFMGNILINKDPDFMDYERNDYRLDSLSQAVNQGNSFDGSQTPNASDIVGKPRSAGNPSFPDLGAFERQF